LLKPDGASAVLLGRSVQDEPEPVGVVMRIEQSAICCVESVGLCVLCRRPSECRTLARLEGHHHADAHPTRSASSKSIIHFMPSSIGGWLGS
jgi:hypothetical protein